MPPRRIFWGQTLAQAIGRAAQYHSLPVDRVAYTVHEKRHGFVRHPRAYLVEVDPGSPEKAAPAERAAVPAPTPAQAPASRPSLPPAPLPAAETPEAPASPELERAPRPEPAPTTAPRGRDERAPTARRASGSAREEEVWDTPDEESALAAAEASRLLFRLAGADLEPKVVSNEGRLEIEMVSGDLDRLRELGVEILDEIEFLLPRAIVSLCGRRVRCRIDGAGLRAAREEELRAHARKAAERVESSGDELLFEPLNPAERRIIHLELEPLPGVRTESVGSGFLKRVRIQPTAPPSGSHD